MGVHEKLSDLKARREFLTKSSREAEMSVFVKRAERRTAEANLKAVRAENREREKNAKRRIANLTKEIAALHRTRKANNKESYARDKKIASFNSNVRQWVKKHPMAMFNEEGK